MKIFAHRGASGEAPDNTLTAFELALEQGAEAIELDLQRYQDEIYILHDRWLHHCTKTGHGLLENQTPQDLAAVDAGDGKPIPTLWQVLELCAGRCQLNLELKAHDLLPVLVPLLERAVDELGWQPADLLISSFHHRQLAAFQALKPDWPIGLLISHIPLELPSMLGPLKVFSLHLDCSFIDKHLVYEAQALGLKVYVYTVDEPEDLHRLQQLGVDGIFSNYPARSREWLLSHIT
ncbi:glycerophosphodiester phosphodiesterase [Gallaecimonas pentaromativorans]|uniref:Glycerophosphoryl diester phosphodiesterase n=1 Tax=Gallaecimonas pentaromativorans TaxID=584787 RepID=A0A3N1P2X9_9GAMM|nr:glycerophosphodiester phosphodiesterase [Gallaecimonas pentaromativorans]MED5524005.1 glycerophosphodiester phosphodiesterase [Pseudomonadota bacterium]ROQ22429.1 glycerophosphoryl diester phosphodiesterase [Gallaecimonas pentaromativorans]